MNTDYLRQFIAVYECGELYEAAKQFGITRQGLSRNIKILENSLGVQLFERSNNGMAPTEFAEIFIGLSKQLLALEETMTEAARAYRHKEQEELTIAVFNDNSYTPVISDMITEYCRMHPDRGVRIVYFDGSRYREILEDLLNESIDLAVMFNYHDEETPYEFSTLFPRPFALLACKGNPVYGRSEISYEDLANIKIFLPGRDDSFTMAIEGLCLQHGVELKNIIYAKNVFYRSPLIADGSVVVPASKSFLSQFKVSNPGAQLISIKPESFIYVDIIRKRGRFFSPTQWEFINYMVKSATEERYDSKLNWYGSSDTTIESSTDPS